MGNVIKLFHGRSKSGHSIPKLVACADCDEPIEAARLQVMRSAKRCIDCERGREQRHRRMLQGARDRDVVIIRG